MFQEKAGKSIFVAVMKHKLLKFKQHCGFSKIFVEFSYYFDIQTQQKISDLYCVTGLHQIKGFFYLKENVLKQATCYMHVT